MVTDFHNDRDKKMKQATALLTLATAEGKVRGTCLSDEKMAGLVDGRDGGAELSEYWQHLGSCMSCYDQWLFLKKNIRQDAPRGRLYHLSWLRKFRYIGTALAVAASIAVYLNVVKMEDKVVEPQVVQQKMLMQDKNTALSPPLPAAVKEKKMEPVKITQEASAVLPAAPTAAPMAVGSSAGKGRLDEVQRVPRQSAPQPLEDRKKSASTAPMRAEREVVRDTARDAAPPPAESALAPAAAPLMGDVGSWLAQLRMACVSGQEEALFWTDLAARGLQLKALTADRSASAADKKMVIVLALVQGINGPDTVPQQCRLILAELAEEGGNKPSFNKK